MVKFVSYYTKNTGYEKEIKNLVASLEKFKLDYNIESINSLGSWQKNTQYKALFLKKKLKEFGNIPLVFLDADAIVCKYPFLFTNLDCDIGIHYFSPIKKSSILLSGTIYIQKNERTLELLDKWINLNKTAGNILEQKNLQKIIDEKQVNGLKVYNLPPKYTCIFDTMSYIKNPVIQHMQASRRLKKTIK